MFTQINNKSIYLSFNNINTVLKTTLVYVFYLMLVSMYSISACSGCCSAVLLLFDIMASFSSLNKDLRLSMHIIFVTFNRSLEFFNIVLGSTKIQETIVTIIKLIKLSIENDCAKSLKK